MALELKIGTEKATANLKNVEAGISRLQAALSRVSSGGFATVVNQINSFKGINPSAVASVQNMAQALSLLSRTSNLGSLAAQLNSLGGSSAKSAADGVQQLANALANVRVPPGLNQLVSSLNSISGAARNAATSMNQLASIRVPNIAPQVSAGANALVQKASAANNARTAVSSYGSALGSASGVLNGFGIALGGVGFAQFIKGAYEAGRSLDGFKQAMKVVYGDSATTATALKSVDKVANDLGIGLSVARKGFAQIATSMNTAGMTTKETEAVFKAFSTVFRVMNTDAGDMARGFRAVNQIFSKGQIMAEEMKNQLGEIFPAVQELAQALNMSPDGLVKAMEKGQLSSREMLKMAEHLQEKYGKALPEAMNTLGYAVQRTMNGFQHFLAAVGDGLAQAAPALNRLADAMTSPAFLQFGSSVGRAIGTALQGIATAFALVAENITYVGPPLAAIATALAGLAAIKVVGVIAGWAVAMTTFGTATATAAVTVGTATTTMGTALSYVVPAFRVLAIVGGVVMGVMTALGIGFGETATAATDAGTKIDGVKQQIGSIDADGIYRVKEATTDVNKEMGFWQSVLVTARDGLMGVEKPAQGAATAMDNMGKASVTLADSSKTTTQEMNALVGVLPKVQDNYSQTTGYVQRIDGVMQGATKETFPQHRSAMNQIGGQLEVLAGDYDRATGSVRAFINAMSQAMTMKAGGGGMELRTEYEDYSTGGLTSPGSGHTSAGKSRWFHSGTSKYAVGGEANGATVPGGGIPAILHSNEAVIPLQGGGIPVVGGGSDPFSPGILGVLHSINEEVPRIYEAVHAQTEVLAAGLSSITGGLTSIDARLVSLQMAIGRSGGGGGGSSGGGGGGGGGSGPGGSGPLKYGNSGGMDGSYNGMNESQWREIFGPAWDSWNGNKRLQKMQEYGRKNLVGDNMVGSGYYYGHGYIDSNGKAWARGYGPEADGGGARLGTPNARDLLTRSFRGGSPNASKDTYGGFTATLHPDEAVIPLPDGRSVPVVFPQQLLDRMGMGDSAVARRRSRRDTSGDAERGDAFRRDNGGRPTQVVVNMTIQAQDVSSFRNSKQQIMQELRANLDQATKNIGMTPRSDDPTRRLGKNG